MTTHVAQLTPKGRGAIASLLVEGPRAAHAVAACFHPHPGTRLDPARLPIGRVVTGRWHGPGAGEPASTAAPGNQSPGNQSLGEESPGEELVVCRTGEQQLEVHCHGGHAAIAAIVADLRQQGCVEVAWDHVDLKAHVSRLRWAAQRALARATTERTALILLDQFHGALARDLRQVADELRDDRHAAARRRVVELLGHSRLGLHLTEPWRVVLAGPPNVGKSSLINALVGFQRAIVFNQPGTTRDVVSVSTAIDGWPVELSDTAGIRTTTDQLESAGVGRTRGALRQADLVIWVKDATQAEVDPAQADIVELPHVLIALNQCDRMSPVDVSAQPTGDPSDDDSPLLTSALTGQGVPELLLAISRRLVPAAPPAGAAVPFCAEHVEQLRDVLSAIDSGDSPRAALMLSAWCDGEAGACKQQPEG